jgi:hypothetical protein
MLEIHALIIGIDSYASPDVGNLSGAKADAQAVFQLLVQDLGIPSSRITLLLNEQATRSSILKAFDDLRNNDQIQRDSPIIIYFAGHGALIPTPQQWLEPGETASYTKLILPYDVRVKVVTGLDEEIRGIPDRTLLALTTLISREKGDNIVCVLSSGLRT